MMTCLFIIGNGFDIAHGLPTKYQDFQQYLYQNHEIGEPTFSISSKTQPNGAEVFNNDELVTFLNHIISEVEEGELWSDIETSLGRLSFEDFFDQMSFLVEEENLFRESNIYEDATYNFLLAAKEIRRFFSEWMNSINTSRVVPIEWFNKLIDIKKDKFLTFNYTPVLQNVYGANNVEHIHGEQGKETIIGHGIAERCFDYFHSGSRYPMMKLHDALMKHPKTNIKRSLYFFEELTFIEKIFSYGFSFSDVDLPYIEEVCKRVRTENVTWFLNDFDSLETREKYKVKIRECGFKGEFNVFGTKENSSTEN